MEWLGAFWLFLFAVQSGGTLLLVLQEEKSDEKII